MMHEHVHCPDEAASHYLSIAAEFSLYYISQPTKNTEVVLFINCFAQRGILVVDSTFPIKKYSERGLDVAATLPHLLQVWRTR